MSSVPFVLRTVVVTFLDGMLLGCPQLIATFWAGLPSMLYSARTHSLKTLAGIYAENFFGPRIQLN